MYPVHPSQADNDLMYSVLYDDFTAENAKEVIAQLDAESSFPDAPAPEYMVRVTYTAGDNGYLDGSTTEWVKVNSFPTQVPITRGNRGYTLAHWEVDGQTVNDPAFYRVTKDTIFKAVFEFTGNIYDITFKTDEHGYLDVDSDESIQELTVQIREGEPVQFPRAEVLPDEVEDYRFLRWEDEAGEEVDKDAIFAERDATYTAVFEYIEKYYTVTFTHDGNGSVAHDSLVVAEGGNVPFPDTTANEGYEFDGWYKDGVKVTNTRREFVTSDVSYEARFTKKLYTITFECGPNGTNSNNKSATVPYQEKVNFPIVTPDYGYQFDGWYLNGEKVDHTNIVATVNATYTAQFVAKYYTITFEAEEHGSLTGNLSIQVQEGARVTFPTPSPATGYHFDNWYKDEDTLVTTANERATADTTYVAKFLINVYTITFSAGPNGSIPEDKRTLFVQHGDRVVFPTPEANYGYEFYRWENSRGNAVDTTNVIATANADYTVRFQMKYFTVTFETDGNGTVATPSNRVQEGARINFPTVTPSEGYEFYGWYKDGEIVDTNTTIIATEDVTYRAQFKLKTYVINFEVEPADTGTLDQTSVVLTHGDTITFPQATPIENYELDGWYEDDVKLESTENVKATKATTYTAKFKLSTVEIKFYKVEQYAQDTTRQRQRNVTESVVNIRIGDSIGEEANKISNNVKGTWFDSEGNYISNIASKTADSAAWYVWVNNTEDHSDSGSGWNTQYYKHFYAGIGGHLELESGGVVYAGRKSARVYSQITNAQVTTEDGWEFIRWANLDSGNDERESSVNPANIVALYRESR